jgi:hypothetical protein
VGTQQRILETPLQTKGIANKALTATTMSRIRRNAVLIQNPLPGAAKYTTRKAARGFIRRGLSVFAAPDSIRFLDQARRVETAPAQDGTDGIFRWHRGKTGRVVQLLGSTVNR